MTFRPDPKKDYTGEKLLKQSYREKKKAEAARNHRHFYEIVWRTTPHKCYECGEPVTKFHPRFVHHVIEKHLQDRYTCDLDHPDNGVILCWNCHNQVHANIAKTPKVQALTFIRVKRNQQYRIK